MLFRKIKKTLELNKTKIDHPGTKIYYDSVTLWFSLCISAAMIIGSIVFTVIEANLYWLLIGLIVLPFLPETIRKLIFKNPVFIFQRDRFYYSLENYWFDKSNCEVRRQTNIGTSVSVVILISGIDKFIEVSEDVFYLDDAKDFRKEINQYLD